MTLNKEELDVIIFFYKRKYNISKIQMESKKFQNFKKGFFNPPHSECANFDFNQCYNECADIDSCEYLEQRITCPACKKSGYCLKACEDSGWNYYCEKCETPFDLPLKLSLYSYIDIKILKHISNCPKHNTNISIEICYVCEHYKGEYNKKIKCNYQKLMNEKGDIEDNEN